MNGPECSQREEPSADRRAVKTFDDIPAFRPHRFWRGGWLQTASIKFVDSDLSPASRRDSVDVSIPDDHTPPDKLSGRYFPATSVDHNGGKPLVIVFHGMGGHAFSGYMRSIAETLNDAGYDTLLWNHRGAGRSGETCSKLHHPGYTEDVRRLLDYLLDEQPDWSKNGLACVAFSLGANLLLKYLAETGEDSRLDIAVSISAPLDMEITSKNLKTGVNRIFDRYLLRKQQDELLRANADLGDEERTRVAEAESVWELDDRFTSKRLGYEGVKEFYKANSAVHSIQKIRKPTLLIHAEDDPIVDPDVFDGVAWDNNQHLYPAMVTSGGHTGFLDRKGQRWHEQAALAFLNAMAESTSI